eukprot:g510.t1
MLFTAKQSTQSTLPLTERLSFEYGISANSVKDCISCTNTGKTRIFANESHRYLTNAAIRATAPDEGNNDGEMLREIPLMMGEDFEKRSELRMIIQTIHGQHLELLRLSRELRGAIDKMNDRTKEERKLKSFLDKCSLASRVLYDKNLEKERRIGELKEQLEMLHAQSCHSVAQ